MGFIKFYDWCFFSVISKDFGRFSPTQLLELIVWLPKLSQLEAELQQTFFAESARVKELAPRGFRWSGVYELPIADHLARLVVLMGKAEFVCMAAQAADSTQVLLDGLQTPDTDDANGLCSEIVGEAHSFSFFISLLWAVLRSFECVAIYGEYINDLVARAREGGADADKCLLKAVRIDPTVVSGPTGARRISRAVLFNDDKFLAELRLAFAGKTGDQCAYLRKFRFAIKALSETGALGDSPTALARRLVDLGIYEPGPSAVKNATELIRKARNLNAI